MADFVEQNLEKLVPLFERLKVYELLSEKELSAVIRKCRYYEYRCHKGVRRPTCMMHKAVNESSARLA